ncbi:MAG: hypothetical protein PHC61_13290 [Chitinivibrionales bacterium]|nr:hypothetical protein [Chitinivibrionales bacterium]
MNLMDNSNNEIIKEIYYQTRILRKPISGIVSGYHELPYILVSPDDAAAGNTIEINGKISVSPKFIISPGMLSETFGEVFDPETFDKDIEGRLFSFAVSSKKNVKIANQYFLIKNVEGDPEGYLSKIHDDLLAQENVKTALVWGPRFKFYPVSLDRLINEILDREFRV